MSGIVDEKYYEAVPPQSIAERLLVAARDRIYKDFIREMRPSPSDTILDVGISDVLNAGANVLEREYPYKEQLTACGVGDALDFQQAFPTIRYVQIEPNKRLPFPDKQFTIATANAVLEHVGSRINQKFFVSELCRVAQRVFISVPHRYFPVEHHTGLPFLHYSSLTFRLACRVTGKLQWTREENLILMSRARLQELIPSSQQASVKWTGLQLGPFSSNLFVSISQCR